MQQSRKSGSSSEGPHANHHSAGSDGSSNQQRPARKVNRITRSTSKENCDGRATTLVKSGSFSGSTDYQQSSYTERSNNPSPLGLLCCHSGTSTSETEDCSCGPFGYDNNMNSLMHEGELNNQQFNADSDVEMNSVGNNSLYEQAWDNYQVMQQPPRGTLLQLVDPRGIGFFFFPFFFIMDLFVRRRSI